MSLSMLVVPAEATGRALLPRFFKALDRAVPNQEIAAIDKIACIAKRKDAPAVRFRIEGHTDNTGKLDENMKLSQARADSVRDFLVNQGVPGSQLVPEGYGPTRPIASNASKAGKAANRRVEFRKID